MMENVVLVGAMVSVLMRLNWRAIIADLHQIYKL